MREPGCSQPGQDKRGATLARRGWGSLAMAVALCFFLLSYWPGGVECA